MLSRRTLAVVTLLVLAYGTAGKAQGAGDEIVIGRYETIYSNVLGEERIIKIRLPREYEDSGDRYPVLYVLDAEMDPIFEQAVGTVGYGALAETGPEMIVVGICNTDRNRDMIPEAVAHRPRSGGSTEFLRFVAEELMPRIDREYRTDFRNVLYGASNSGLFTVFAILRRPDVFTAGIAASPMIGHASEFMYRVVGELRLGDRFEGRALYMTYGEHDSPRCTDFAPAFKEYIDTLRPVRFRTELVMVDDGGHVPYVSLYNGLRFVFADPF